MSFDPEDKTLTTGPILNLKSQSHLTGERFAEINANLDVRGDLTKNGQALGGGGVTNSAPVNTVPKSDGANLVASRITDDGTIISSPTSDFEIGDYQTTGNNYFIFSPTGTGNQFFATTTSDDTNHTSYISIVAQNNFVKTQLAADSVALVLDGVANKTTLAAGAGFAQPAPASTTAAILANGQISFYLDELGNTLKVAVKYSDGTAKTGTIALL